MDARSATTTITPQQRIVPRIRLQAGDHGIVGVARFYTEAFRPFEEAGLELGAVGTGGTAEGVELLVAGFRLLLTDAADDPGAAPVTPAANMLVNVDPVFFGWSEGAGDEERRAACSRARAVLDTVWDGLVEDGGTVLMPLDGYPFSARYGWVQDRFGMSWQLMLTDPAGSPRPAMIPSFMFCGTAQNKAAEAVETWTRVFGEVLDGDTVGRSRPGSVFTYPQDTGPAVTGSVMFSDAQLAGVWISAMDSGAEQPFTFSDAVSFRVYCDTPVQAEVLRRELGLTGSAGDGSSGVDRFGVSWDPVQRTGSGEAR